MQIKMLLFTGASRFKSTSRIKTISQMMLEKEIFLPTLYDNWLSASVKGLDSLSPRKHKDFSV